MNDFRENRPLRSAALVMLTIAATDWVIDTIEYFAGTPLWKMMLATGFVVLLIDIGVNDRGIVGQWLRSLMQHAGTALKSLAQHLRLVLSRLFRRTP